jgi:NitT/TauT family transport system substrate-binding protein
MRPCSRLFRMLLALWPLLASIASAQAAERIVVSVPGPRNISYLPIDLIPKLGFDRAEGVNIQLIHTGGGAVALNNMVTRNADFSVAGMPAAMSLRANGGDVVTVAAVDDAPLFILMVRAGLKHKVRRVADLKGHVIGVNTSTRNSKTTSQQLAELVLKSGGVSTDMVRIVPAGQSWEEQSSLLITGAADAVMGDEPFASRLLDEGKVFFLVSLADPATARKIRGADFLHAAVETRSEIIRNAPGKVEKMVSMLRKTLKWMASHSPDEIVAKLDVTEPGERESLLKTLRKYPHTYSRDGSFSTRQLKETEVFFRTSSAGDPNAQSLDIDSMVDDRWAGRRK